MQKIRLTFFVWKKALVISKCQCGQTTATLLSGMSAETNQLCFHTMCTRRKMGTGQHA